MNLRTCQPDKLRGFRAELNVPVFEIANALDVSPSLISQWLNGRTPLPEGMGERLHQAIEKLASLGVVRR